MKELRERIVLPSHVDLGEPASAEFVVQLAANVAPGLERSVGSVEWTVGDATGVDWSAEGFIDGALLVVSLRSSSREVSLLVIPGFASATEQSAASVWWLLVALFAGVTVALMTRSFGWGVASVFVVLSAWIGTDMVRNELSRRRAIEKFDLEPWRQRFQDAVASVIRDRGA